MANKISSRFQAALMLICFSLIAYPALAEGYQAVRIVAPESEQTVHDNSGNLAAAAVRRG